MMTEIKARELLNPMFSVLYSIPHDAFAAYFVDYKDTAAEHSPVSKASLVHDRMVRLAHERLSQFEGVKAVSPHRRDCFEIKSCVLLQFKKLTDEILPRNYQTEYAKSFNGNDPQSAFKTIPVSLPRLTVGYVADQSGINLSGVYIACQKRFRLNWYIDLVKECTGVGPTMTEIPFIEEQPATRARVKGGQYDERTVKKQA